MITVPECTKEQLDKLLAVLTDQRCPELYFIYQRN